MSAADVVGCPAVCGGSKSRSAVATMFWFFRQVAQNAEGVIVAAEAAGGEAEVRGMWAKRGWTLGVVAATGGSVILPFCRLL